MKFSSWSRRAQGSNALRSFYWKQTGTDGHLQLFSGYKKQKGAMGGGLRGTGCHAADNAGAAMP